MISIENFKFFTKKERERRKQEYAERIFHLGEGHRETVEALLEEIFSEKKRKPSEKLYPYILLKNIYLDHQQAGNVLEEYETWYHKAYYTPQDKRVIMALVLLDVQTARLEDYPSVQRVRERAAAPDLQRMGE